MIALPVSQITRFLSPPCCAVQRALGFSPLLSTARERSRSIIYGPWLFGMRGKVRGQTPKVVKQDKKKPRGRAYKRMQYNLRFVTAVVGFGKKRGPNLYEKCERREHNCGFPPLPQLDL